MLLCKQKPYYNVPSLLCYGNIHTKFGCTQSITVVVVNEISDPNSNPVQNYL